MKFITIAVLFLISVISALKTEKIGEIEHIEGYTPYKPEKQKLLKFIIEKTKETPELQARFLNLYNMLEVDPKTAQLKKASCLECKLAVKSVSIMKKQKEQIMEYLEKVAEYICNVSHLLDEQICDGTVQEEAPYVLGAVFDHYVAPDFLCPLLNFCPPVYEVINIDDLVADILKDKPTDSQIIPKQQNTFKFLHFSDMHTEVKYDPKWNAKCGEPTCCIPDSGLAQNEEQMGGYWGSYGQCDIPTRTAEKLIQYIKNHITDIDFAIWTGDNTGHDVWQQSQESNLSNSNMLTKIIQQYLPDLQIIPIFGNHEPFPVNIYEWGNSKKFNEFFADLWKPWIGEAEAKSLKEKSYYEKVLKNGALKVIVLNTQSADVLNFSLIKNPTDPGTMLQNLRKSLQDSEAKGQAVYIAAHIPSGALFLNNYAKVFSALIDRYNHIIMGQFTGHTHNDEFELYYTHEENRKPISMNWIAPSVTTYDGLNPSFRVFQADSETFQIVNMFQYRLNLTYWNQFTDPSTELMWDLVYDMLSEYNLPNVYEYQNIDNLRQRIGSDLTTFNKYYVNYYSGYKQPVDQINKFFYCHIEGVPQDQSKCKGRTFIPFITEILAGPWLQKIKKTSENEFEELFE